MPKVTLTDIESGYQLKEAYNANNDALETAIGNTLSRDGTTPNQMEAAIDMNSNKVINVAQGVAAQDAVNVAQLEGTVFSNLDVGSTPVVHTYAALTAIPTPTNGDSVFVDGDGIAGLFVFDSSEVTAANGGTIFDADDATTGSWVRRYSGPVHVTWYGANPTGAVDATLEIQAALDSASHVHISAGTYMIDPDRVTVTHVGNPTVYGLSASSNQLITGDNGTVLEAIAGTATRYSILAILEKDNVRVKNIKFLGERTGHTGTTGEHGYGIDVKSSTNVFIEQCTANNFWGDGFDVDCTDQTSAATRCENVWFVDCHADNNRRQGLSVKGCVGLHVIRGSYTNTNGTDPQAGIDFEPNNIATFSEDCWVVGARLEGNTNYGIMATLAGHINVRDCHFKDNGRQHFYMTSLVSLSVSGCTASGSGWLRLADSVANRRDMSFSNNDIDFGTADELIVNVGLGTWNGRAQFFDNRITFTSGVWAGVSGAPIALEANSDSTLVSQFCRNVVTVPLGFAPTNLISGDIFVYATGSGAWQVSDNDFVNGIATTLDLSGGATAFGRFGAENRHIGNWLDVRVNGDVEAVITWGSIGAGAASQQDVSVQGARVGDIVELSPQHDPGQIVFSPRVISDNIIRVLAHNPSALAADPSGTFNINVRKPR